MLTKCKLCKKERYVKYQTIYLINKGKLSGLCKVCSGKENDRKGLINKCGLVKGRGWNKGLLGFRTGKRSPHTFETKKRISLAVKGRYGKNASNWQGGKTKKQKIRMLAKHLQWRKDILIRDCFECRLCKDNNKLEVHHIIPFSKNESLRLELSNGLTLCKKCHRNLHRKK